MHQLITGWVELTLSDQKSTLMTNSTVTIYEVMSQTKGIRMSRFGITNMWVAKIICFSNAHGDVAGDWFLGPELQLGCN